MAEPYCAQLSQIIDRPGLLTTPGVILESRHFFSGAALYADGVICALLGPSGFALKLPVDIRRRLHKDSQGAAFRFFAKGPVKREYVMLSESIIRDNEALRELIRANVNYVAGLQGLDAAAESEIR